VCTLAVGTTGNASTVPGGREPHCDVGGPPAWPVMPTFSPGMTQLSPEVIIACGRRLLGQPFEIVGLDTSDGLWIYFDSVRAWHLLSFREPHLPASPEPTITIGYGSWGPPARSEVLGVLTANVARVEVIFHDRRQHRVLVERPTMAQVSGELLGVLHQTKPFGAYAMTMPGYVPPKGIRVIACDARGSRVGSARDR
jgi:hypothetical protein